MGTKMAPLYANIFMEHLEGQLLKSINSKPHSWLRFIDDIDMQVCYGHEHLNDFHKQANTFRNSIKFPVKYRMNNT